ncbi:MAG: hypothetical protein PVJ07_07245 [Anaerolineales bacterium]|jgi:hypothetical protein
MVKYYFVTDSVAKPSPKPIGVFEALARGFDRIAARPILILPPLVLDLIFWLGPHLRVTSLVDKAVKALVLPAGGEPALVEQLSALQQALTEVGQRLNLLVTLSNVPVGVPSLMAARLPVLSPLGSPRVIDLIQPSLILGLWFVLLLLGLGLGAGYNIWIARQVAVGAKPGKGLTVWGRMILVTLLMYVGVAISLGLSLFLSSIVGIFSPLLGMVVFFGCISLLFWVGFYLYFTPHGVVLYDKGVMQAMLESAMLVRANLFGVVGFIVLTFIINLATNQVWFMPDERSWYSLLALVGHAFVSSVVMAGTYAFYQGRRQSLMTRRTALAIHTKRQEPPGTGA